MGIQLAVVIATALCASHACLSAPTTAENDTTNQTQAYTFIGVDFTNHQSLFPNTSLYWKINDNDSTIDIGLDFPAQGWVALGISEEYSGSMQGSDMYVVEAGENGSFVLTDRYTLAKTMPELDTCSHGQLLHAEFNGTLRAIFRRALDTNDTAQDRPIVPGAMRIVWAHGNSPTFGYHGDNRGMSAVTFIPKNVTENAGNSSASDNTTVNATDATVNATDDNANTTVIYTNMTMADYPIGTNRTTYVCIGFNLSDYINSTQKHHAIAFRPILDSRTMGKGVPRLHHVVFSRCSGAGNSSVFEKFYKNPGICSGETGGIRGCSAPVFGYAQDSTPLILPLNVGYVMGGEETHTYYVMQMHYDNPGGYENVSDSSGLQMEITTNLRENDASSMWLGAVSMTNRTSIPANSVDYEYEFDCPEVCTQKWKQPITVIASFPHMHQLGTKIWATHWAANGTFLGEIARVDYFDFDSQRSLRLNKEVVINPGDRINTHCVYTNPTNETVSFGEASNQEMCLFSLLHYPSTDWLACAYASANPPHVPEPMNITFCGQPAGSIMGLLQSVRLDLRNPSKRDPPLNRTGYFGETKAEDACSLHSKKDGSAS